MFAPPARPELRPGQPRGYSPAKRWTHATFRWVGDLNYFYSAGGRRDHQRSPRRRRTADPRGGGV